MRLGILIKDSEYRDALVRKLSSYDNDIFVNVLDGSAKDSDGCLILTDIQPAKVEKKVLDAVKDRTVFITIVDTKGVAIASSMATLFDYIFLKAKVTLHFSELKQRVVLLFSFKNISKSRSR